MIDTISNMTFKERLKNLLDEKNLSVNELAELMDVDPSYISRLKHGHRNPSRPTLIKIAKALGVSTDELLGLESAAMPDGRMVPVISWVQAGIIREPQDPYNVGDSGEGEPIPSFTKDPLAFALRVQGDSMAPEFSEGEFIVVSPSLEVVSGDFCVFKANGKVAFKQYKKYENTVILRPLNPTYPELVITGDDLDKLEIIGKVIQKGKRY